MEKWHQQDGATRLTPADPYTKIQEKKSESFYDKNDSFYVTIAEAYRIITRYNAMSLRATAEFKRPLLNKIESIS